MSEGGAPARDILRGLHVSLCWTSACHRHLRLPSPQALSSLCPQQHLAFLTILIWTPPPPAKPLGFQDSHPTPGLPGLSSFSDHLSVSVCAALLGASWETCPPASPCPPDDCPLSAQSCILMASLPHSRASGQLPPAPFLVSCLLQKFPNSTHIPRRMPHGGQEHNPAWPGSRPPCPVLASVQRMSRREAWLEGDTKHLKK